MPLILCPHKKEPGYVTARRCTHPAGGWVVLFDRKKGGLPQIQSPMKSSGRYVMIHLPTKKKWAGFATRKEALKYLLSTAKGEDTLNILPETVPPPAGALPMPPPPENTAKVEESPHSPPSESSRARGEEKIPDALQLHRALLEAFPAQRIVAELEAGLMATKSFVVRNKSGGDVSEEVIEAPDYATRVKYLVELGKFRIGKPSDREKPSEPRAITMDELEAQCIRSPAARRSLRRMIDAAEQQSKLEAEKPPAKGPEKFV